MGREPNRPASWNRSVRMRAKCRRAPTHTSETTAKLTPSPTQPTRRATIQQAITSLSRLLSRRPFSEVWNTWPQLPRSKTNWPANFRIKTVVTSLPHRTIVDLRDEQRKITGHLINRRARAIRGSSWPEKFSCGRIEILLRSHYVDFLWVNFNLMIEWFPKVISIFQYFKTIFQTL